MSELAVRLGSVVSFDRTGTVIFIERFENGISGWEHNSSPAEAFAVPTARYYSITPYCLKFKTTTQQSSISGIYKGIPIPYVSRMGFEFHIKQLSNINHFLVSFIIYDGTYEYAVIIDFDQVGNEINLYSGIPSWETIRSYNLNQGSASPFHVIKIVVDLEAETYYRLVIDEQDYDISHISVKKTKDDTEAYLYAEFFLYSFTTVSRTLYLDNFIVTIDEPR